MYINRDRYNNIPMTRSGVKVRAVLYKTPILEERACNRRLLTGIYLYNCVCAASNDFPDENHPFIYGICMLYTGCG